MLLLIYILLLFNVLAPNVSFWYALFPKFAILCKHLLSSGKCDLSDISWGRAVLCWYIIGGAKSCQITANEIGRENLRKRTNGARHVEELKRSDQELTSTSSAAKRWPPAGEPSLVTPSWSWTSRSRKILTTAAVAGNQRGRTVHCTWFRCGDVLWRCLWCSVARNRRLLGLSWRVVGI